MSGIIRIVGVILALLMGASSSHAGFLLMQYEYQRAHDQKAQRLNQYKKGIQLLQKGEYQAAIPPIYDYVRHQLDEKAVLNDIIFLTETGRAKYWEEHKLPYTNYLPILANEVGSDTLVAITYDAVLLSKSFLLNTSLAVKRLLSGIQDKNYQECYNLYLLAKNTLDIQMHKNEYIYRTTRKNDSIIVEKDSLRAVSNHEKTMRLRYLVDSLNYILLTNPSLKRYSELFSVNWIDVRSCLEQDDAAIEFIDFSNLDGKRIYAALVLRKDYDYPVMMQLFEATEIEFTQSYPYVDMTKAYQKIWKPLLPLLKGVHTVYFSPTGILHRFPIEYLADDRDLPINWRFNNLCRLTSTRELVTAKASHQGQLNCTLFGGLHYTLTSEAGINYSSQINDEISAKRTVKDLRGAITNGVRYLPGSLNEVQAIGKEVEDTECSYEIITGDLGTEKRLRDISGQNVNILHIATHGFYVSEGEVNNRSDAKTISEEDLIMQRSGIMLSGANLCLQEDDADIPTSSDGIMTALEMSELDLSQTDLVVLSACETALGDVKTDGVYGLQRGLKKAGVQSELLSLWPIDDEATSVFMTSFYRYFLDTRSKLTALRLAQQALIRHKGGKYLDPSYWGAFILIDGLDFSRVSQIDLHLSKIKQDYKHHDTELTSEEKEIITINVDKLYLELSEFQSLDDEMDYESANDILLDIWNSRKDRAKKMLEEKTRRHN